MEQYSYQECLERSHRVNWKIDDVIGGMKFDRSRVWLPESLSAVQHLQNLTRDERRLLTQVEMGSYAHLFGYVEEFIAPKISSLAQSYALENGDEFHALSNFVAEEIKHMALFDKVRWMVDEALGFSLKRIDDPKKTAAFVLSKSEGSVLLLTAAIEWFTQRHYIEAFHDRDDLDPLSMSVFRNHWLEESQHAKMDHNETLRVFEKMNDAQKDQAIEDLIELIEGVHGLLKRQSSYDVENFERTIERKLSSSEKEVLRNAVLKAKEYTFLMSGVTHPNFAKLLGHVASDTQKIRVGEALKALLS